MLEQHLTKRFRILFPKICENFSAAIDSCIKCKMSLWLDHLMNFVNEPIILLMDKLPVHYSKSTKQEIESMRLPDGRRAITMRLLPAKTAFLLIPLDMGAFAAMKTYFYKEDRSSYELKLQAARTAWDKVSNETLVNL